MGGRDARLVCGENRGIATEGGSGTRAVVSARDESGFVEGIGGKFAGGRAHAYCSGEWCASCDTGGSGEEAIWEAVEICGAAVFGGVCGVLHGDGGMDGFDTASGAYDDADTDSVVFGTKV